jgi:beclin 1
VQAEMGKHRSLLRALNIRDSIDRNDEMSVSSGNISSITPVNDENQSPQDIVQNVLEKLEYELQVLTVSSQEYLNELNHLDELIEVQAHISKTLTEQEDEVLTEFNALEIDANSFQDMQRHLTHQCHAVEIERFLLSKVQLHSSLFDITVDDRVSKRFPLINNLRLTHRPTPKGVSWLEINAAWSQAAQLVICIGSATRFKSKDLRIVPLTSCAKIIELLQGNKIIVNHLGVDFESNARKTHETENIVSSVRAFHALLYQLSAHMLQSKPPNVLDKIPFEARTHSIGSHDLRRILEMDDVGWGGVIHCMAANMNWMVQNSCKFAPLV